MPWRRVDGPGKQKHIEHTCRHVAVYRLVAAHYLVTHSLAHVPSIIVVHEVPHKAVSASI